MAWLATKAVVGSETADEFLPISITGPLKPLPLNVAFPSKYKLDAIVLVPLVTSDEPL